MAKQTYGILDGYRGTVGTVIGYQWRGRWCLRARPRQVRNPQTAAQQEHRMLFRDMVQLAGRMKQGVRAGLHAASLEEQMTECNLFVKMNKAFFTPGGVDYASLSVSRGPVAPVAFTAAAVDVEGVLHLQFEKNPLHLRTDGGDEVQVYAFCPALQQGQLSAPSYRRTRRLDMVLPDEWAGLEVHYYGFVTDHRRQASETLYIVVDEDAGRPGNLGKDGKNGNQTTTSYETAIYDTFDGAVVRDGAGAAGDGLGLAQGCEDGDADAGGCGAGGAGADTGCQRADAADLRPAGRRG